MKISLAQLASHLSKPLAPIYLISGDETLLVQEALDAVRLAAKQQGFLERDVLTNHEQEWTQSLYAATHHLSLLSNKKLLELDLNQIKLTPASSKLLQEFASHAIPDVVLLIRSKKLDTRTSQSAWHQAIEKKGIVLPIWPISLQQLPTWIKQRSQTVGLTLTSRAAELLAHACEGNLLAAAQEIEKLALVNLTHAVDEKIIIESLYDNAHFDIYMLVESALAGNLTRCLRILKHLQAVGVEPTLIAWALANELRLLNTLMQEMQQGATLATLFSKHRIWEKRQGPIQQSLRRFKQNDISAFLLIAAEIDRVIKGVEAGDSWDELQRLALAVGGGVLY